MHDEHWALPSRSADPGGFEGRGQQVVGYATDPDGEGEGDVLAIPVEGWDSIPPSGDPVPLANIPEATESHPALSPDGRWLAYLSDEAEDGEIWMMPFPNPGGERWRLAARGVTDFVWAHSGQDIYYSTGGSLWAIEVDSAEVPSEWNTRLVDRPFTSAGGWDIGEEDRSFLTVRNIALFGPVTEPRM